MAALRVVEHFEVVEHVRACLSARGVDLAEDSLALEQPEETPGDCAFVAVAAALMLGSNRCAFRKTNQSWLL